MLSSRVIKLALCVFLSWNAPLLAQVPSRLSAPTSIEVFQGDVAELQVVGDDLLDVEGSFGNERIRFYLTQPGIFTALIGADLEAAPGSAKLLIKATTRTGAQRQRQVLVQIKAKRFPEESFSVPMEFEPFTTEALDRIRRERQQFSTAFSVSVPQRLWEGPFLLPVSGDITSPFGFRRVINGIPRAPHSGVDLRARSGTDVLAANHGRVVLAGDFFFNGKSLVLDHGGGLYTMYFHLSEFKVDAGINVCKGEVIALSGMSGRVTGPHLHWGARINGARVNPFELLDKLEHSLDHSENQKAKFGGGH